MRRWIWSILPIVCLAVLVQLYAPVGATHAMAAAQDPLRDVVLCLHDGGSADQSVPPLGPSTDDGCCHFCLIAHAASVAQPTETVLSGGVVAYHPAEGWARSAPTTFEAHDPGARRARGPPTLS